MHCTISYSLKSPSLSESWHHCWHCRWRFWLQQNWVCVGTLDKSSWQFAFFFAEVPIAFMLKVKHTFRVLWPLCRKTGWYLLVILIIVKWESPLATAYNETKFVLYIVIWELLLIHWGNEIVKFALYEKNWKYDLGTKWHQSTNANLDHTTHI